MTEGDWGKTDIGFLQQELTRKDREIEDLQRELREVRAHNLLGEAMSNISEAIVLYDNDGRLIACNANFRKLYGYTEDQARPGVHFSELGRIDVANGNVAIPPAGGDRESYLRSKAEYRERLEGSFLVHLKDGRWIRTTDRRTSNGGFASVQVDVTELILREQEVAKARDEAQQAVRSKSQFLANMSHDLRTPLNAITGFSEIMQQGMHGPLGDPRYEEYISDILASGKMLLELVDSILDVSKLEVGHFDQKVDLFDPIAFTNRMIRLLEPLAAKKNITLTAQFSEDLPEILYADEKVESQLHNNLISNAIKNTEDGGEVTISWQTTDSDEIAFSVQDTGCGMPQALLARLGEPFVTGDPYKTDTDRKGTGLGLYICKKLLELSDGRLQIESELGLGTTVTASRTATLMESRPDNL